MGLIPHRIRPIDTRRKQGGINHPAHIKFQLLPLRARKVEVKDFSDGA